MMVDPEKTAGNLIDHQRLCHLATLNGAGFPEIRAMLAPREREGIRVFYLTTNTSSQKVAQLGANPMASLYFTDGRFYRGLCFCGKAEILTDPESRRRIWREGDTAYYKQGADDPDYCVIRFTADTMRYYSSFKTKEIAL